jgi:mannose-1-phosphate guanylyltransferase / mannose-6-phosphate isomerase
MDDIGSKSSSSQQSVGLITPVLLSGGAGTRLWPMSRALYPKQLLPLASAESMLVVTARRMGEAERYGPPVVICNDAHRFIVAEQLREAACPPAAIVLEPVGRNTGPAAAIAALIVAAEQPDGLLLLASSDGVVREEAAFNQAVAAGAVAARAGHIVTFGVKPDRPETGYGYIRLGTEELAKTVFRIDRFVEKPDRATAERYLAEGGYVWNSGIFLSRADRLIEELETHAPQILAAARTALARSKRDLDFIRLDPESFAAAPALSIDYAVMEKTRRAAVVPVDIGWNDVGSWAALWDIGAKDTAGNVVIGDAILEDVSGSYIRAEDRLVAAIGIKDMVLVVTDDAVLLVGRDRAGDVGKLVARLKEAGRGETELHSTVYRPWGSYQGIDEGDRFQVKRLIVKPGGRLSSQLHHHRAEHWVVVHGTAKVTRGDEELMIYENESVYIPIGTRHRLENPGKVPLHLIEVQSGSYLGEDDIVRFDDDYGRG